MGVVHPDGTTRVGGSSEMILNPEQLRRNFNSRSGTDQNPHLSNAVLSAFSSQRPTSEMQLRMFGSLLFQCWIRQPTMIFLKMKTEFLDRQIDTRSCSLSAM